MGTYYAIYAEVRVGNQWYNLNPLFQRTDGNIDVCPVISGRNWLREAYEELEEVSYTCGRPENLSREVRSVFCHEDDEPYDPYLHIDTYKDFYNRSMFLVNYGKSVKGRVKKDKPNDTAGMRPRSVSQHLKSTSMVPLAIGSLPWNTKNCPIRKNKSIPTTSGTNTRTGTEFIT